MSNDNNGTTVVLVSAAGEMTVSDPFSNPKEMDRAHLSSTNSNSSDTVVSVGEYHHLFGCIKLHQLDRVTIFVAELLGTAILLSVGCSSTVLWAQGAEPSSHIPPLVFGLTVAAIVQSIGCISGAHLNPAVTIAAVVYKAIPILMAPVYIVAQVLGSIIGVGLVVLLTPYSILNDDRNIGFCTTVPHGDMSIAQTFFIEYIATMVLIIVICSVWDPRNAQSQDSVPIKIGLVITVLSISFGPFTGCSVNPVRTLGPAIFNNSYTMHWVYWLAPISSGIITALFYKTFMWRDAPKTS